MDYSNVKYDDWYHMIDVSKHLLTAMKLQLFFIIGVSYQKNTIIKIRTLALRFVVETVCQSPFDLKDMALR